MADKTIRNKSYFRTYILIGLLFSILISTYFILSHKKEETRPNKYTDCNQALNASAPISPSSVLNDKNDIQLVHAQKNGLKQPFATNAEFDPMNAPAPMLVLDF